MYYNKILIYSICFFMCIHACMAQPDIKPVAKFSFDHSTDYDEVSKRKIKLVNVNFTDDRFGNADNAVFISGNDQSYINLGNYSALKPTTGSISLWVKVYEEVWSGKGHYINPIILTKSTVENDFYESYALYYALYGDNISTCATRDSMKQISISSAKKFERFKWHHLVISYNDDYYTFYIDGKKESQVIKGYKTRFLPTDSVVVGTTANKKNVRYLMGAVDDVLFYDRVLTDKEVAQLYEAPDPNRQKVLLMWLLKTVILLISITALTFFIRYRIRTAVKKEKIKYELENKLLETELRVNRASMNPHFLFNSLNALHNFILSEETDNASSYLIKFSKLIRKIIESNMYDSISLKLEIEILEQYIEVENMRFKENIKHAFILDDELTASTIHIPVMMLQPFIENAVWHGLLTKQGDKVITVSFSRYEEDYIYCVIEDNGTGRKTRKTNLLEKKSLATGFVMQRLELLNKIHDLKCTLLIEDKPNNTGTIVRITLPVLNP